MICSHFNYKSWNRKEYGVESAFYTRLQMFINIYKTIAVQISQILLPRQTFWVKKYSEMIKILNW